MRCGQPQVVNVSISQVNHERLSSADIPGGLIRLKDSVVELNHVSKMKSCRGRWKHEEDVIVGPCIAVRQRPVEFLDGRAHDA